MDINGKTAIITGGASGLGGATTRLFAEKGVNVVILDRDKEKGEALAGELGDHVRFLTCDVTSEENVQAAIELAVETFGGVHIACNFAGIAWAQKTVGKDGPHSLDAFRKVIEVNLIGSFNVIRLAAIAMMKNEPWGDNQRGVIINTASVAAYEGQMGQAAYSASKGGIVGMTLPIARDLAREGIRVNTVAPGLIKTPLFEGLPEEAVKSLSEQPLHPKRLGDPAEIAHAALFIAENDYVNGETIRVDAGIRMQPR
ncbi:3-hydroxyacyl-CoA dehydrogenase [Parvularcula maris]|uniref:3-hydroxyacyl-CoA dehydrogenase n=1 Tax=Parvularcula maris TaxID=2965077 RepID=A0A9X2RIW4_9PROT|nr:3-hydroxyacyl-CoA dehydrogenase [Parvularcula maris]MCQ8185281.1 3-hydroxyacyl-CoA dehydrogenase [Parvularcula maris]